MEHATRRSGRAVRYPGVDRLVGTLTVAELLDASAIQRVIVLGAPPAGRETVVQTRDFVRPQWQAGVLMLMATPYRAAGVAPCEVPDPLPCCAGQH